MEIHIDGLGKQFVGRWVFRDLSTIIQPGTRLGITGPNGSGKSTFLAVMIGSMPQTSGAVRYIRDGKSIDPGRVFQHLTVAAPYADMIEEMRLREALEYHTRFRPFNEGATVDTALEILGPEFRPGAEIKVFSSGMKQRLRLVVALLTASDLVVLDEPTSNLDSAGKEWYHQLIDRFAGPRTVVVASNEESDMSFCQEFLAIPDYSSGK